MKENQGIYPSLPVKKAERGYFFHEEYLLTFVRVLLE